MMSKQMTSVYSGGLMYEYSLEDNDYGIVKIKGDEVKHQDEFKLFKKALEKYPTPTGDGGASKETHGVDCPPKDPNWQIDTEEIPEMPKEAQKYMKDGAGDGPGFKGGSQTAGDSGTATASVSGGMESPTSDAEQASVDGEDAGVSLSVGMGPMMVTGVTFLSALFGAILL